MKKGVFKATKKNGSVYYRASISSGNKHISLGSFDNEEEAGDAYNEAYYLLNNKKIDINRLISTIDNYSLPFEKCISLINYRDNKIYFVNPIYISKTFFYYYLTPDIVLKFDADELFFYSSHKIMQRGSHLFISDFGNQIGINQRYGIRPHSIKGKDYIFLNDDYYDYRLSNIKIINSFYGVKQSTKKKKDNYRAVIHIEANYTIGHYNTPEYAAIAYNKAADILNEKGYTKVYPRNNLKIIGIDKEKYIEIYNQITISDKISNYII